MSRIIVLDAGPLGLASKAAGQPGRDACLAWVWGLATGGVRVVVPEVADYEVRRELIRSGATAGVVRLDRLISSVDYDPITTAAIRRAAEFWALVRRAGLPTAHPMALDADCILAAQATLLAGPGDAMTIATSNPRHITRFPGIDAHPWQAITA